MNPIRRRPCADPGQKPVPGEWMTQKGIDSSRPVTEASRANVSKHTSVVTTGHTGITRHSPRNGFNGFLRALPGDQAFLSPSPALLLADLTPASGRQNHTTSPSASAPFVKGAARVHRIPPHVRDDRETPLRGTGPNRNIPVSTSPSSEIRKIRNLLGAVGAGVAGDSMLPVLPDQRPARDATHSISISIAGFGSAWTTQVVRAG